MRARRRGDTVVGEVEEALELLARERSNARVGLALQDVLDGVSLMTDLNGDLAEPLQAYLLPSIRGIHQVRAEPAHDLLIGPDRADRPSWPIKVPGS